MIGKRITRQPKGIAPRNAMFGRIAIYGGAVVVALLIIATFCLWKTPGDNSAVKTKTRRPKIKSVESPIIKKPTRGAEEAETKVEVDPRKLPDPAYNKVLNPSLPPKKYIPTIEEVENARLGPDGKPRTMSIYKTPTEQAMGVIFSTELGSPVPMLPSIPRCTSKEQLEDFLNRSFAYDKDASRAVNENRILMSQVQTALNEYLNDGGNIGGFIDYYVGELNACHEQWKTAQRMLVDMARSGEDAETLRGFRDAANKLLSDKGIKPLSYPPSVRAAMGEQ